MARGVSRKDLLREASLSLGSVSRRFEVSKNRQDNSLQTSKGMSPPRAVFSDLTLFVERDTSLQPVFLSKNTALASAN